jgi:hypothetical protein
LEQKIKKYKSERIIVRIGLAINFANFNAVRINQKEKYIFE